MGSKVPSDPNLSPELNRFLDSQARANDTLSGDLDAAIATIPVIASNAEAVAGVENTHFMTPLRVAQEIAALSPSKFTKEYVSTAQTITSAGALTLAHGLGVIPKTVAIYLVNVTAENGYSIGDVVMHQSGVGLYTSITVDATNLNVRFTSNNPAFSMPHKTTGAFTAMTNANWSAVFSAWA